MVKIRHAAGEVPGESCTGVETVIRPEFHVFRHHLERSAAGTTGRDPQRAAADLDETGIDERHIEGEMSHCRPTCGWSRPA